MCLLHILGHYGVRGQTSRWISAFLAGRTQKVICEGSRPTSSPAAAVISGVPQGTVLGPLLFLAYINDLPDCLSSTPRLFTVLLRSSANIQQWASPFTAGVSWLSRPDWHLSWLSWRKNSTRDSEILQNDVDKLQQWEEKWMMSFNPDKCEVLRLTLKRQNIIQATYRIHGQPLKSVSSAKYLLLTIDSKLNYNEHVSNVCKKANSTRAFIHRNTRNCLQRVKAMAYTTYVRPQLEYVSTVHEWMKFI